MRFIIYVAVKTLINGTTAYIEIHSLNPFFDATPLEATQQARCFENKNWKHPNDLFLYHNSYS